MIFRLFPFTFRYVSSVLRSCSVICDDGRKFGTVILIQCSTFFFFNSALNVPPVGLLFVADSFRLGLKR